jgi:ATP-dependent Clp protease ATP-binding subunit ClpC
MSKPLTDPAKMALQSARTKAVRLRSPQVDPEHILMGIIATTSDFGRHILTCLHVDIDRLGGEIESLASGGSDAPSPPSAYDAVIRHAEAEPGYGYVGTEHLLIGVLLAAQSPLADRLNSFGLSPDSVRARLRELVQQQPASPPCDICGAESTVHITEATAGASSAREPRIRHLCVRCAST